MQEVNQLPSNVQPQFIPCVLAVRLRNSAKLTRKLLLFLGRLANVRLGSSDVIILAARSLALTHRISQTLQSNLPLDRKVAGNQRRRIVVVAVNRITVMDQMPRLSTGDRRNPLVPEVFPPTPDDVLNPGRVVQPSVV